MKQEIEQYLAKHPAEITALYAELREIIFSVDGVSVEETLWAKLPSYYCGESFIRLIPFKDHINIEASGLTRYAEAFPDCKFTPKGMMQVKAGQTVDSEILKKAFLETLTEA